MNAPLLSFALTLPLLVASALVMAEGAASFGSGGYASQVRTMEMMHKIDTDRDGMVSKDEWDTYYQKLFAMMDLDKSSSLEKNEFMSPKRNDVPSFATGGYSTTLRTADMFTQFDANEDGAVSRDEFLAYHEEMFGMMDSDKTGVLDESKYFGRGGKAP